MTDASRRSVYPITSEFEGRMKEIREEYQNENKFISLDTVIKIATMIVGEYEHGSVDIPEGADLRSSASMIADVVHNIALEMDEGFHDVVEVKPGRTP